MRKIKIQNCNNINTAIIRIEEGKLNIKYAMNGTGKSSIAKALLYKDNDLLKLQTFGKEDLPRVECDGEFSNICLFNSDFVENIVFNGNTVIENTFEVFIKNEKYDEQKKQINTMLSNLKNSINNNDYLRKLNDEISRLEDKISYNKEKDSINSTGVYKSIKENNNIFKIPPELNKYNIFLSNSNIRVKWADWKIKGQEFDNRETCPYCARKHDTICENENQIFKKVYKKANVDNVAQFCEIMDNIKPYLNDEKFKSIDSCIKENISNEDKDIIFKNFMNEVYYLEQKFSDINTFDSYKIDKEHISNLEKIIKDLKISTVVLEYFKNDEFIKQINTINTSLDEMISKISELKKEIGEINSNVFSQMEKKKNEVNNFLKLAGFNYEFDIVKNGDETQSVSILKYVNADSNKIEVEDIKTHLSWGEKNAFALVLFMYYALSKKSDLIILDDPISSFDGNKKYAIINRLFSNKGEYTDSLHKKTVLLLTHDFEPIIDFGINHKPTNEASSIYYLKNNKGLLNEKKINVIKDVLSTIKFYRRESINEKNNIISRICFLRKYLEHTSTETTSEQNAYNILSSLIHGKKCQKIINNAYVEMDKNEIDCGEQFIKNYIKDFDNNLIRTEKINNSYIISKYNAETSNYKKVQLFRVYLELTGNRNKLKDENNILLKFIDEMYHIENDYIFSLDLCKFDIIPEFIMEGIDCFMEKQKNKECIIFS